MRWRPVLRVLVILAVLAGVGVAAWTQRHRWQAPEHPEVLLLTAQVQLEEGQLPAAQKTTDRCVAVDPKLADCWLTLGVLRQNNKDTPGAVAAYEEYLKLAPTGHYARDATSQLARLKK